MIRPQINIRLGRAALVLAVCGLLAACDSGFFGLFSSNKDKNKLPGTRISVLALERELRPNIEATDTTIALPPPEDTDTWPQAGGLSHHAMHQMMLADSPKVVWKVGVGAGSGKRNRMLAEPIVAEGHVYTVDAEGNVDCFDAGTGKQLWRVKAPPQDVYARGLTKHFFTSLNPFAGPYHDASFLGGGIAYDDGRLFVTGGFAQVVALDAKTGKDLWRAPVEAPIHSAPAVNGGRVFVTTVENQVVAVAEVNGKQLWTYSGASAPTILLGGAAPAVDGGVVLAAFTSGELVALRVDNGAALWTETVTAMRRTDAAANLPDVVGRPVVDRGRVYAVGQSGILVAIDLRTGQRVWDAPVAGVYSPWIAGDFIFALTLDAEAVCIDVRSGHILWVTQLPAYEDEKGKSGRIIWAGPSVASDRLIVVGSNSQALAVSPYSGAVMSRIELAAPATLPPVFAKSTMYLLDDAGDLAAYR